MSSPRDPRPEEQSYPEVVAVAHLLERFQPGWSPNLWVDRGWYRLVVELDAELAALEPDYVIYQVKEKFGCLRFYFELPVPEMRCCRVFHATNPAPPPDRHGYAEWLDRFSRHNRSSEHVQTLDELSRDSNERALRRESMQAVVDRYEAKSRTVCELTGRPGRLMRNGGVMKTLSDAVAVKGWEPVS